jgi:tubulin-folding cofactor B
MSQIAGVKERFRKHIGTPPDFQKLILLSNGRIVCELSDDSRMLGFYSVESGNEIHIVDTDPFSLSRNGGLTDISLVEKYKISDEAYDQRKGTMREFIRENRKKDPNYKLKPAANPTLVPGPESVEGMNVGDRCEVQPGARRGTVRFVGEVPVITAGGHWVSSPSL